MACKTSYDLHHNFPRLAEETGFAFNTHRPRVHIDWNKIRLIDIESLARDRKFVLIEQHVNDILDCVLESEFDVRILDEGVVKLFRLAQLAVEYQQFCRHYLDRSVFVLRQEIDTLAQELASTKKELQDKEEEIRKLRRKGKHGYNRPLLSYSNDNIATMILKTLTNKGEMFPSTNGAEAHQYNKCKHCDKVFLNQLYLKSHISRRHGNMADEIPQKEEKELGQNVSNDYPESKKLNEEINQLKLKIKEMENLIIANKTASHVDKVEPNPQTTTTNLNKEQSNTPVDNKKEVKDKEVSANDDSVFEKLEEWKRTEQENHTKEINLLRNQIFETLNSFREKENTKTDESDSKIIEHLRDTIKEQGSEILALKQALTQADLINNNEDKERKKEMTDQMLLWAKRDEAQTKQYELLLQKLNEVATEAREFRSLAESERKRADKLETLLRERLTNGNMVNEVNEVSNSSPEAVSSSQEEDDNADKKEESKINNSVKRTVDQNALETLHRKAQELLSMKSSSSSDVSSEENVNNVHSGINNKNIKSQDKTKYGRENIFSPQIKVPTNKASIETIKLKLSNKISKKVTQPKKKKSRKESETSALSKLENGPIHPPGSPMKVIRAKITEEVNNRLVQAGVDPLKSRLHQSIFQKQKYHLQQQLEMKSKKYPAYEQVRYTIMAYLDSDASGGKRDDAFIQNNTSSNTLTKAFSLSSMISNVKSKALSLVKSKETKTKCESKPVSSELVKKATSLLKTPPESPISSARRSSPKSQAPYLSGKRHSLDENHTTEASFFGTSNKSRLIKKRDQEKTSPSRLDEADSDTIESNSSYKVTPPKRPSQSIVNLIKSPARRPSSANADYNSTVLKYTIGNNDNDHLIRTQSVTNVSEFSTYQNEYNGGVGGTDHTAASNDDIQALLSVDKQNKAKDGTLNSLKQTKSVLKNASSISSLNKKKVLFDMDAIQMKSVSASPSQSLTEKSDDKYELGLVNIDNEEWDISSIENEPIHQDTQIHMRTGPSPKIAELKQTIEAQLARRSETPSTALFGVDTLRGPGAGGRAGGSTTSLGSSILDGSDTSKPGNHHTVFKPKKLAQKDDSDLDLSDFSIDGLTNKNERDSF